MAGVDVERPMLGVIALIRRIDYEITDEAGRSPEILFRNLMAYRAGDAVFSLRVALFVRIKRKVREDLRLFILHARLIFHDGHVAMRAFVLNVSFYLGMIKRLAPYTSLPGRIARGGRHNAGAPIKTDGEVFSRFRLHTVVAGDTAGGRQEIPRRG